MPALAIAQTSDGAFGDHRTLSSSLCHLLVEFLTSIASYGICLVDEAVRTHMHHPAATDPGPRRDGGSERRQKTDNSNDRYMVQTQSDVAANAHHILTDLSVSPDPVNAWQSALRLASVLSVLDTPPEVRRRWFRGVSKCARETLQWCLRWRRELVSTLPGISSASGGALSPDESYADVSSEWRNKTILFYFTSFREWCLRPVCSR